MWGFIGVWRVFCIVRVLSRHFPHQKTSPELLRSGQWCFMKTMETLTTAVHMQRHTCVRALLHSGMKQFCFVVAFQVKIFFKAQNFAQLIFNTKNVKNLHLLNVLVHMRNYPEMRWARGWIHTPDTNLCGFKSHTSTHEIKF